MKTKIEIENGNTVIVLLPENKFEETLIQNWYEEDKDSKVKVYKKNTSGWHNALPENQVTITLKEKVVMVEPMKPMDFIPNPIFTEPENTPPIWVDLNIKDLSRGTLVRHKASLDTYMVDASYGERATVTRSVDITNESEWEVLRTAR